MEKILIQYTFSASQYITLIAYREADIAASNDQLFLDHFVLFLVHQLSQI